MTEDERVGENQEQFDPDIVDKARKMGWVDRHEWRGDPSMWREPGEFVRRGSEFIPIIKSQLAKKEAEFEKREREFTRQREELESRIRRQEDMARRFEEQIARQQHEFTERTTRNDHVARLALERQRQTFLEQIDAAKRLAVQEGDAARYDGLVAREQKFYQDVRAEEESYQRRPDNNGVDPNYAQQYQQQYQQQQRQEANQPPGLSPHDQRTRDEWIENNSWFNRSDELNAEAQRIHVDLWQKHPGLSLQDNLRIVEEEIKKRHPDKFGVDRGSDSGRNGDYSRQEQNRGSDNGRNQENQQNNRQNQRQYSSVEDGGSGSASQGSYSRQRSWADIHPDDRALAMRSYIRTGFYGKDEAKAQEAYAKDYWEVYND